MGVYDMTDYSQYPLENIYHTYVGADEYEKRKAFVGKDKEGFYVVLANDGLRIDKITCYEHSEVWAENVAENYVLGVLNP